MSLQEFLVNRKQDLLHKEKSCKGRAKDAIVGQVQVIESILIFLQSNQEATDMAKLQLTLDKQSRPMEDLKLKRENSALTEALIEVADSLKPNTYKQLAIPDGLSAKSIVAKVYFLKKHGKLPDNIKPVMRRSEIYLAKEG